MTTSTRYGRFVAVGAMGMAVQLAALALLHRISPGHYLLDSAAALELTLLHNFFWHIRSTWRDREAEASRVRQCMRFHLSNGAVSMIGNLGMMRLLAHGAHVPVVVANLVAILLCSAANFCVGDRWAFRAKGVPRMSVSSATLAALVLFGFAPGLRGQSSLPSAPVPAQATRNDSYLYHAGVLCSVGAGTSASGTRAGLGCGAGITLLPIPVFLEVGLMDPQTNRNSFTGYVSVDGSIPLARTTKTYLPMAIVGYSRLFENGHALDYGVALAMPRLGKRRDPGKSMRIELRDDWAIAHPNPHSIMLRVGWMTRARD